MNLELEKFRKIVENRINNYWYNEIPSLEPASAAIRIFTNLYGRHNM